MALLRLALLALCAGPLSAGQTSTQAPPTIGAVPLGVELTEAGLREDETFTEATSISSDETSATTSSFVPSTATTGATTSPTAFPGMVQWAPYKGKGRKRGGKKRGGKKRGGKKRGGKKRGGKKRGGKKGGKKGGIRGYGGYRGRADVPGPRLQPTGRQWVSKDKVKAPAQILNIKPSFLYPEMEVGSYRAKRKGKKNGKNRTKRATNDGPANPLVAVCGGTFRELYGVIQSPDFPLYYPNNKKCTFDIEVPANHTLKLTCDRFMMQGGQNCTHDYMMVDYTGDSMFANGQKFCGLEAPSLVSNGTRMTVMFQSDDLFRYQGFNCRYRALQPNGNAVIGSFGNTTDTNPYSSSNNFLQVVQCPHMGSTVNMDDSANSDSTSGAGTGASLYSGMWNGQCGSSLPALPPTNRIVGGYATEEFQFPWMAGVLKSCEKDYCHICGGTIISESWILTGAHCMANVAEDELGVLVGDHNLYTISNSQKFIKVKEKVVHPDYNKRGNMTSPLNNDIGLLRLEYPIVFTSQISPLCLPALGETGFGGSAYGNGSSTELDTIGLDIVGKNATVLGWGMVNDEGDFSTALRGVQVEILDNMVCNKLFGIMTETMMCTSGNNGRGTCYGDSGGPAIVTQPDGSFVQVGISSFGALAGCEKGYPSGQVLVHKYIDWIQSITGIAFGAVFG